MCLRPGSAHKNIYQVHLQLPGSQVTPAQAHNAVVIDVLPLVALLPLEEELVGAEQQEEGEDQQDGGEAVYELRAQQDHERPQHHGRRDAPRQDLRGRARF